MQRSGKDETQILYRGKGLGLRGGYAFPPFTCAGAGDEGNGLGERKAGEAIFLIFRVFNLGKRGVGCAMYLEPTTSLLGEGGELNFKSRYRMVDTDQGRRQRRIHYEVTVAGGYHH